MVKSIYSCCCKSNQQRDFSDRSVIKWNPCIALVEGVIVNCEVTLSIWGRRFILFDYGVLRRRWSTQSHP